MNVSIQVFDELLVQATATDSGAMTSAPFAALGNKAVTAVTVPNFTATTPASNSINVKLQGSYDGLAWKDLTLSSTLDFNAFEYKSAATTGVDVAWVRLHVEAEGLTGAEVLTALVDAYVAFSEQ